MAQDFYAAFGKDKFGVIGNDTTINQADIEGVSFVMIQALEKRSREQEEEIKKLKDENATYQAQISQLNEKDTATNNRLEALELVIQKGIVKENR
jgi:cell division protein FtsB